MPTKHRKKVFTAVRMEPALKARLMRISRTHGLGNFSEAARFAVMTFCDSHDGNGQPPRNTEDKRSA